MPLIKRGEHLVQLGGLARISGELPGLALLDVAVQAPHALPDHVERLGGLDAVEQLRDLLGEAVEFRLPAAGSVGDLRHLPSR